MTFSSTTGMCGRNSLKIEMVSANNASFDWTDLKNNLNYALDDFISNSDTTFAWNKKSTSYTMLVNRTYNSASLGTTASHLSNAIKALA